MSVREGMRNTAAGSRSTSTTSRHNWAEMKRLVGPGVRLCRWSRRTPTATGRSRSPTSALKNGASCLGVANADEGVQLRVSGITAPIIILSPATEFRDRPDHQIQPDPFGFRSGFRPGAAEAASEGGHPRAASTSRWIRGWAGAARSRTRRSGPIREIAHLPQSPPRGDLHPSFVEARSSSTITTT